jgi:hypothetical protein
MRFTNNAWDNVNESHLTKVVNYRTSLQIENLEEQMRVISLFRAVHLKGSLLWKLYNDDLKQKEVERKNLINKLK